MKTMMFWGLAACAGVIWAGAPVIREGSVTIQQNVPSRVVTIGYTLEEQEAIVTIDIQTNGVSIGGENLRYFAGNANRLVQPGDHVATWRPDKAWPGHKIDDGVSAVVTAWAPDSPPDYMTVSLISPGVTRYYASAEALPGGGVTNDQYKTDLLVMRRIPAANVEWRMGGAPSDPGYDAQTETARVVTLANDYYIGVYEVTQRQYELLTGVTLSYFGNRDCYATRPVDRCVWMEMRGGTWPSENGHADVDPNSFIGRLRNLTGFQFDLPTEAQWEFAARAGCGMEFYDGHDASDSSNNTAASAYLSALGRYGFNGGLIDGSNQVPADCTTEHGTAPVGSYAPNAWGLYDMLGNVWETCLDYYVNDCWNYDWEQGPPSGTLRSIRGGDWSGRPYDCRCSARVGVFAEKAAWQNRGLRVVCPLP